jgi:hypothetical protein
MRSPSLTLVALVLTIAVEPATAQGGVLRLDSATVAALAALEARIDRADSLRVKTPHGSSVLIAPRLIGSGLGYARLAGPDPQLDGSAFLLQTQGRMTRTGAIVGAVALGLTGAVIGFMFSGLACLDIIERPCSAPWLGGVLVVGVIGAAGGAAVGAVVGASATGWRTIYRYPPPRPYFY